MKSPFRVGLLFRQISDHHTFPQQEGLSAVRQFPVNLEGQEIFASLSREGRNQQRAEGDGTRERPRVPRSPRARLFLGFLQSAAP